MLPLHVNSLQAASLSGSFTSVSTFGKGSLKGETVSKKNRWGSSWHFIVSMLSYCVTSQSYAAFTGTKTRDEPNVLQYLLCYFLFGMPLMYMQIFLGQYTQMGMFYLKYCIPLFKGLAHAFMICVLLDSILAGSIMTDELMYFLLSFQEVLPWSKCPEEYKHLCIFNKTSSKNYSHPALIFWRYVYMDDPVLNLADITTYDLPSMQRIVSLLTTWALTFGIVCVCYYNHRKFIRVMFYIYSVGTLTIFFAVATKPGATIGLSKLLEMRIDDFYSATIWRATMLVTIEGLALSSLYHMYAGAFLSPSAQAGALSVACLSLLLLFRILMSAIGSVTEGLIIHHTGLSTVQTQYSISKHTLALFITIPQGLSYLSLPQLWTAVHFGTNIILSMCNQLLNLISMQAAITDLYPNFHKFRVYVFGVISIFSSFIGLSVLPDSVFAIYKTIFTDVLLYFSFSGVLSLSVAMFLVYGVTNLSDDIHFMMGSQPTKYWKICWYLNPVVLITNTMYTVIRALAQSQTTLLIRVAGALVLLSPIIIFLMIEILSYIKKRNLLGAIRPTELWGPPDPDDRVVRRLFNPRLETRFQAYKLVCEHSCLFANKYLKNIINQENCMRRDYLMHLVETKRIKINIAADF